MTKTALITGGAIRVGKAISLALAADGYDIALHYNSSSSAAIAVKAEIEALGQKCTLFQADLSQKTNLIQNVINELQHIDILVNNASIFEEFTFMDSDESAFDRHMNINFKAPFFLTQEFAKICKNGNVINILDTFITKHSHSYFTYLMTKKIFADFTKMAARELAPEIRVNAVALGSILPAEGFGEEYLANKEAALPSKRRASLEDATKTIIAILNNEALIGQILFVDGGENL